MLILIMNYAAFAFELSLEALGTNTMLLLSINREIGGSIVGAQSFNGNK